MAIIAKWSGDGIADGTDLTTTTAGPGDTPFSLRSGTAQTVVASDVRSPRIQFAQAASQASYLGWSFAPMTSYAVRVYLELTAHASASIIVITGLTANNATAQWRVTLAGTGAGAQTGQIRITNGAGTTQASSGSSVIPLNQVVRLEAVIQSGAFTATAYSGDTNTVIATATATTVTTVDMDAVRFGPFSTAPTVPTFYLDDFALSDTAALIGPPSPAPSGATWSLWNGTSEVPLSLEGVWNGTSVTPLSFDRVI